MQRQKKKRIISLCHFVRKLLSLYRDCHLSSGAAATAYYLLLALFPMGLCLSVLLYRYALMPSLFREALSRLFALTEQIGGVREDIDGNVPSVLFFAAMTALLSASAGAFRCLYRSAAALSAHQTPCGLWGRAAPRSLSGIFGTIVGYLFATVLFFAVYATVFLSLLWEELTALIAHLLGGGALTELLFASRGLVLLALFFCLCLGLLSILPPSSSADRRPWRVLLRETVPGALFCTCGLSGATAFFALFIRTSTRYSLIYGSLASTVLFLMWLFICANVLLLGVSVNVLLRENHRF